MNKTGPVKTESRHVSRKTVPAGVLEAGLPGKLGWNLPSGEGLAEFALRFGFLAPTPMRSRSGRISGSAGFRGGR